MEWLQGAIIGAIVGLIAGGLSLVVLLVFRFTRAKVTEPRLQGTWQSEPETTIRPVVESISAKPRLAKSFEEGLQPAEHLASKLKSEFTMQPPQNPAGEFVAEENIGPERRAELIAVIENAPANLRKAVAGLSGDHLDTRYRNWTIRQIVHHLADSHVNSYVRFKWALTEEQPTIKAYYEDHWVALHDSRTGNIQPALALLDGLHARWVLLLRSMSEPQFARSFIHPESGKSISLNAALSYYAWHCRHHTAQITWVREQHEGRMLAQPFSISQKSPRSR